MSENPSTRWGELVVGALADAGVDTIVVAPGSRSTPLVVAAHEDDDLEVLSIIDERSAAYFAVGRAKRTGTPAAVVCTSGTAGANMHPAVIEADRSRTPIVVCTADRPADLQEAGANQTIAQSRLFGDAVRYAPVLPAARSDERTMQAVRSTVSTAVRRSTYPLPGPVHLNIPFRKPLSPAEPIDWAGSTIDSPSTISGESGVIAPTSRALDRVRERIEDAERALVVAGPLSSPVGGRIRKLADALGIPVLADPISGARFGKESDEPVLGGYDAYLDPAITGEWPDPEVVLRFGARPTSVRLQEYLRATTDAHVAVDPIGAYRDPAFSTSTVIAATPDRFVDDLLALDIDHRPPPDWLTRFADAEQQYWELVMDEHLPAEGRVAHETIAHAPDPATVFVSNSMPIRDVDRFGAPSTRALTVLGNRGASGIDGVTSSGLGAASATDDPVVLLLGDLAFYHDMNGLLAVDRCAVDATIVVINNDGGGIFQKLPIADVDPPFTEQFRTPHGLDFERVARVYDLDHHRVRPDAFADTYRALVASEGAKVIEVPVDGASNHRARDAFQEQVRTAVDG